MNIALRILHRNSKWRFRIFHEHAGAPALEFADAGVLVGQQASGIFGQARIFVQVDKKITLIISRGNGMRDFVPDTPASGVSWWRRPGRCCRLAWRAGIQLSS